MYTCACGSHKQLVHPSYDLPKLSASIRVASVSSGMLVSGDSVQPTSDDAADHPRFITRRGESGPPVKILAAARSHEQRIPGHRFLPHPIATVTADLFDGGGSSATEDVLLAFSRYNRTRSVACPFRALKQVGCSSNGCRTGADTRNSVPPAEAGKLSAPPRRRFW